MPRPTHLQIPIPPSKLSKQSPTTETAIFQHDPTSPNLQKEWEPGCQPDIVYDTQLSPYRAALRRWLVKRLREENKWMADWQKSVRSVGRDKYFYWTAVFGTHTFFMTFLPMFFFFGDSVKGRGLLYVVGLGIYVSCFAKDLACTPRPYSPPVTRLSMSTHHHEYGFPSSHSTNSVSIALFLGEWLFQSRQYVGWTGVVLGWAFLLVYASSVVGGRLYTGMHSTADIIGGSLMGIGCWALWLFIGESTEKWVDTGTLLVPYISIPLTLALVHYHPEPLDDCPCFEDAIAILSVILGSFLGHWNTSRLGYRLAPSLEGYGVAFGVAIACARVVLGIGIIFAWRLIAKTVLLYTLPPIFRLLPKVLDRDLPHRRFYKPATEYTEVPPTPGIKSVPSFLDIHTGIESGTSTPIPTPSGSPSVSRSSSISHSLSTDENTLKHRGGHKRVDPSPSPAGGLDIGSAQKRRKRRYDADVLTKVGVYCGIGYLATTTVPWLFGVIEGRFR